MLKTAKEALQVVLDELDVAIASGGEITGISSGFVDLDRVTCGWQRENLIFVGSVPGMGTSALLNNFAINAVKAHPESHIAYYSPLSSESEWVRSIISSEGKIDSTRLRRGDLGEDDKDRIMHAAKMVNQLGDRLHHSSEMFLSVSEIMKDCLALKGKGGLDLLIIDGFENIRGGSDRSRELKLIAKELSVPVICSVSLNDTKFSRPDKRPKISDLPANEGIDKISDLIVFVYRHEYYDPGCRDEDIGRSEIIIAKNRHGETGKTYLAWLPNFQCFHNLLED